MPEFKEIRTEQTETKPIIEMPYEMINLNDLLPHEELDMFELDSFIQSLTTAGIFWKVSLVSKDNVILDGHHRWAGLKKLGAKRMPCIRLDYLNNDKIKVYTWYPFFRGSLSLILVELRSLEKTKRIAISYMTEQDECIKAVENGDAVFALIHNNPEYDCILIHSDDDVYDTQGLIMHRLFKNNTLHIGYVDTLKGAFNLLNLGEFDAFFVRKAPTKKEIIERAKAGRVFPPKTTRHDMPFIPKAIHVPFSELL